MLETKFFLEQLKYWPSDGRYILAQYDNKSIYVYQAFNPSIANFAIKNGFFGGEFNFNRMSWIKPGFLWMMYRSGWGTKKGQDVVLAIKIKISFFNYVLELVVPSYYDPSLYSSISSWKDALAASLVRIQWDPDHLPNGNKVKRRAIQLGLRGEVLRTYCSDAILDIVDISDFIASQRISIISGDISRLETPVENVYIPKNPEVMRRLGIPLQ